MSIVIACEQCSARFKLNDSSLVGRSFRCRKCGAAIRTAAGDAAPAASAMVAATTPTAPARPRPRDADPFADVDWSAVSAVEETKPPVDSPKSYRPAAGALSSPARRRTGPAARPTAAKGDSSGSMPGFLGLDQRSLRRAAMLLVVGAILLLGLFIPIVGIVGGGLLGMVGFGLFVIGIFTMLFKPFEEDIMCGLMYLFVPFYPLYYLISRWQEMKTGFLRSLMGYALMMIAALVLSMSVAAAGGRAKDNRHSSPYGIAAPQYDRRSIKIGYCALRTERHFPRV